MQFLALTRRLMDRFPAAEWTPDLIDLESQQVRTLYAAGTIRSIWRRQDMPGAAIVLEAATLEYAQAALGSLPLFQRGMTEVVLTTGLDPYPAFSPR